MKRFVMATAALLAVVSAAAGQPPISATPAGTLTATPLGTVKSGPFRDEDPRIAEINAWDPVGRRIYVVNPFDGRLDVIDASNPANPLQIAPVHLVAACERALGSGCPVQPGAEPNSVAIHGRLMGVAVAAAVRTDNGHAMFFTLEGADPPQFLAAIEVGALPDMIVFTDDGAYALTADEGEPNQDYTIDPPGSVSIVEVARLGLADAVRRVGFEAFDSQEEELRSAGVRIFGPGASVSQDFEPEYIAVSGGTAYVTLQENNAIAIIDIPSAEVHAIVPLGLKDHSVSGNALDASDQDNAINIRTWPVRGMYLPDAIHAFVVGGQTYLITANEGDAREYLGSPGFEEAVRLNNAAYQLDPLVFPNAADLKANARLGRLTVSRSTGDLNGDGLFERIDVFGARSVSILDAEGRLVWESGELFERISEQYDGTRTLFNTTHASNARDNRSDDKGVEPESVVVGEMGGRPYAFVGLERDSGIIVLDLSDPTAPVFVTYLTNRKFPANPATGALLPCSTNDCGDLGPEGLTFVPPADSPNGNALLIVSNETSSTTTIWEVRERLGCDVNGDHAVTIADLELIRSRNGQSAAAHDPSDANGDGRINVADARFCQLRLTR